MTKYTREPLGVLPRRVPRWGNRKYTRLEAHDRRKYHALMRWYELEAASIIRVQNIYKAMGQATLEMGDQIADLFFMPSILRETLDS